MSSLRFISWIIAAATTAASNMIYDSLHIHRDGEPSRHPLGITHEYQICSEFHKSIVHSFTILSLTGRALQFVTRFTINMRGFACPFRYNAPHGDEYPLSPDGPRCIPLPAA